MKASCNGCRVLRKGCRDDCELRDCLEWIRNSQAQANATVFLAKFYGRAGLINLINAGPPDQRATIFRSLLYEACGRTIDPVFGSLGLVCSGNWHLWHAAVQSVLNGCCFASAEAAFPANPSVNPLKLKQTTKFKAMKNPTTAVHDQISRRQSRHGRECQRFLPLHDDEVVSATQLDSDEKQNSNEDKQQNLRRAVDDLELGLSLSSSTPACLIR